MARTVLKERVFAPVGRSLGTFLAMDLETFDMEYTESDEQKEGQSGSSGNSGKNSTVPEPKDDNPIKPEDSSNDSSGGSGASSSGSSSSEEKNDETVNDDNIPDEWDVNGQDLDDEEPPEPDNSDTSSAGGYSDNDDTSSSQSSDGESGEENAEDSEDSMDSSGSDGQKGDQSSGSSGEGDTSDAEDSEGDEEYDSGEGEEDSEGNSGGQNIDTEDKESSENSNSSSMDSGESSSDGDSTGEREDLSYDDWDSGEGDTDGWSQSDLEKAIDTIESNESESSKKRREYEEGVEKEREQKAEENPLSSSSVDPDEAKAARDMLGQAIKDSRESKKNDALSKDVAEDLENEILGAMGAGSLTTMYNPNNAADWKMQLNKVLDSALGFDIITNPNLINKKIEDAPPGREDEIPEIKNIAVLLDCSGSMGAAEFKQVIQHMDTMFQVRKMDKVNFHIIGWGDSQVKRVISTYSKVKGRNFRKEIMKYKGDMSTTQFVPALLVASQKIHKPDAILVLTDADIFDYYRGDGNSKIASEYVNKNRKKIIWVLTKGSFSSQKNCIEKFDPTAIKMNRVIKFK